MMTMRARDVLGIEGLAEAQRGQGAGVLGGVDAGGQQERQPGLTPDGGEVRPLVFAEELVVEGEVAAVAAARRGQGDRPEAARRGRGHGASG